MSDVMEDSHKTLRLGSSRHTCAIFSNCSCKWGFEMISTKSNILDTISSTLQVQSCTV